MLIVYATYSGSTEGTALYIKKLLEENQHEVQIKHIRETTPDDIRRHDLSIIGSPSWLQNGKQGQPHALYFTFFDTYADESFEDCHISLFGLGDTTYVYFCGAVDIIREFFTDRKAHIIAEPLRMENIYVETDAKKKCVEEWVQKLPKETSQL